MARDKTTLINPRQKDLYEREPLLGFSFYLSGRINVLLDTGDEILALLDEAYPSNSMIIGRALDKADTLAWFWTLGAYEMIRTMCEKKDAFSDILHNELLGLKKELADIRMPSTKMEAHGKKSPITSNRSSIGWDLDNKDLLLGDPNKSKSARYIINKFEKFILSLKMIDILKQHEDFYYKHKDLIVPLLVKLISLCTIKRKSGT